MLVGTKAILLTLLAAAAVYFAGNGRVQLWDRDEPRYAQCSRQMLESGDWVVPRLYDNLRFQKPPLIYWCQASAMKVFGKEGDRGAFAARVPSSVAMIGTLVLLSVVLSRHSGSEQAAWTVFVFATSALAIVAAKICLTDSVLIFFIIVAQLCLFAIWRGDRSWTVAIAMAVAVGLGGLTKGPFILGIVGCTAAALGVFHVVGRVLAPSPPSTGEREPEAVSTTASFDSLRTSNASAKADPTTLDSGETVSGFLRALAKMVVGVGIVAVIVVPWYWLAHHRAPELLRMMLHEGKQHAFAGKEGHHFPPGYHFVLVWPMFMPWSLLLPLAIGVGIQNRKIPEIRFALAAVVGPWVMVELMGTKLPHYFLPAYPALAYLVAFAIRKRIRDGAADLRSSAFRIGAIVWATAVAGIATLPWLAAKSYWPLPWGAMVALTCVGVAYAATVLALILARRFAPAFVAMGTGIFAAIVVAFTLYLPHAEFLRVSTRIAHVLRDQGATHPGDVKMVDYKEPSLAFYQGGTIREVERKGELLSRPLNEWPRWVVITREVWDMIPAPQRGQLRLIASVHGLAYADQGRTVEVMVVEKR